MVRGEHFGPDLPELVGHQPSELGKSHGVRVAGMTVAQIDAPSWAGPAMSAAGIAVLLVALVTLIVWYRRNGR